MKTFDQKFWYIFVPFLLFIILILFFPYWLTRPTKVGIDFSTTGNIGDTIGGILGPFIGLAAAVLTFFAFWVQYKANEQQKLDLKIERFENKFYELLRLHQSNTEGATIKDLTGRRTFVHMFYELKFCYLICKEFYENASIHDKQNHDYQNINLMSFSYKIFFYGIGVHSEKHFIQYLSKGEKHLFNPIKDFLEKCIQDKYLEYMQKNKDAKYYTHGLPTSGIPNEKTIEFYYFPFDGHNSKLGHYYRHLFQTANFVVDQKIFNDKEKYSYLKTLRAQLSNYEQLLLYYNSLAWFDKEWRTLFTKFRMIKNIPIPLADFHLTPEENYKKEIEELDKKGICIFEWHE
ncbi:putative phage abortive infection protein [Flavobacterium sp. MAH-1]|uniref:Putative phage abortive infection protein n=2 Tax=Flavobacterium agri TaxID=2743471 RepID=A0A7Y9C731_9FLAO|nr:putative phage abortive infection protein [Flavobacterium agri]NYA72750.1 putative phage abortive infection protein [Flavobacterium agri]